MKQILRIHHFEQCTPEESFNAFGYERDKTDLDGSWCWTPIAVLENEQIAEYVKNKCNSDLLENDLQGEYEFDVKPSAFWTPSDLIDVYINIKKLGTGEDKSFSCFNKHCMAIIEAIKTISQDTDAVSIQNSDLKMPNTFGDVLNKIYIDWGKTQSEILEDLFFTLHLTASDLAFIVEKYKTGIVFNDESLSLIKTALAELLRLRTELKHNSKKVLDYFRNNNNVFQLIQDVYSISERLGIAAHYMISCMAYYLGDEKNADKNDSGTQTTVNWSIRNLSMGDESEISYKEIPSLTLKDNISCKPAQEEFICFLSAVNQIDAVNKIHSLADKLLTYKTYFINAKDNRGRRSPGQPSKSKPSLDIIKELIKDTNNFKKMPSNTQQEKWEWIAQKIDFKRDKDAGTPLWRAVQTFLRTKLLKNEYKKLKTILKKK